MLTIARTLMGNPSLLLLDEPSEGLAPRIVEQMIEAIREMKREGLSLFVSEQESRFRPPRRRARLRHRERRDPLWRNDGGIRRPPRRSRLSRRLSLVARSPWLWYPMPK